jgi:hypothetical protein
MKKTYKPPETNCAAQQRKLAEMAYICAVEAEQTGLTFIAYTFRVTLNCIFEEMPQSTKEEFIMEQRKRNLTRGALFEQVSIKWMDQP